MKDTTKAKLAEVSTATLTTVLFKRIRTEAASSSSRSYLKRAVTIVS